jgi:hypothetical protein
MSKQPKHRVSKRRRASAIRVLSDIATNESAPAHARATAARTLVLADSRDEQEDDSTPKGPRTVIWLPPNGRGPETLGPNGDPRQTVFLYDDTTPKGVADLLRWRRELRDAAGGELVEMGPQYASGSFSEVWDRYELAHQLPAPATR